MQRPPKGRVVYNAFDPARRALLDGVATARRSPPARQGGLHGGHDRPAGARRRTSATFLAAARLVADEDGPAGTWRFLLVGDGPGGRGAAPRGRRTSSRAGVVEFVAPGLEVCRWCAQPTSGVLLTNDGVHAEGCSNSIMEYMACGLPVVANDSGGNRELVEDGV